MADEAAFRVEVEGLAARRGGRIVIENVSFTIEPSRIYVLRGVNGAGKSTLLRALAGLSPLAAGSINGAEGARHETVFLGHADGVSGALTARENLTFWRTIYGAEESAVEKAVAIMKIAPLLHQRAATLSAGQRRRLALCRALLSGRKLWLLDEPTAGMDAASIKAVVIAILTHRDSGGAVIVATHEPLVFEGATTITLVGADAA